MTRARVVQANGAGDQEPPGRKGAPCAGRLAGTHISAREKKEYKRASIKIHTQKMKLWLPCIQKIRRPTEMRAKLLQKS